MLEDGLVRGESLHASPTIAYVASIGSIVGFQTKPRAHKTLHTVRAGRNHPFTLSSPCTQNVLELLNQLEDRLGLGFLLLPCEALTCSLAQNLVHLVRLVPVRRRFLVDLISHPECDKETRNRQMPEAEERQVCGKGKQRTLCTTCTRSRFHPR